MRTSEQRPQPPGQDGGPEGFLGGRLHGNVARTLLIGLTAAVFAADTVASAHRLNLSTLYMLPLVVGAQHFRRRGSILYFALLLVLLTYASFLINVGWRISPATDPVFFYRMMNRGFVALALAMAALLVVFYLRLRDYWLTKQAALAPRDEEVSLLLQLFQVIEDIVATLVAALMAGVTFAIDVFTPEQFNLPILYLVPLAIVAITRSRWLLWASVPVLLALSYVGFIWGPPAGVDPGLLATIATNRRIAAAALVLAAVVFHLTSHGIRSPRGPVAAH